MCMCVCVCVCARVSVRACMCLGVRAYHYVVADGRSKKQLVITALDRFHIF